MITTAALILLVAVPSADVHVVVAPPCLSTFRASGRVGNIATEQAKKTGNKSSVRALGQAALVSDERLVLPDPDSLDPAAPSALLGTGVERVVVSEKLAALKTPEELVFAMPGAPAGFLDGLIAAGNVRGGKSPDIEKINVRLVRLRSGNKTALAIELVDDASAAPSDPLAYDRAFVGFAEVSTQAGTALLVSTILTVGGPARFKPALDAARNAAGASSLTVMPGGIAGFPPRADACAAAVADVKPDLLVPGTPDLALGAPAFVAWRHAAGVVVTAANLHAVTPVDPSAPPPTAPPSPTASPSSSAAPALDATKVLERDVNGLRVAVIGLVDPKALEQVSPDARATWAVDDPFSTLDDVVEKALSSPQPPDLIVVVTASRDLLPKLALVPNVDVVVAGADGRNDALDVVTTVTPKKPRELTREPAPMFAGGGDTVSVRTITASFDDARHLTGVRDDAPPVDGWSKRDGAFARPFRVLEEADYVRDTPLMLPKLDDVLALAPAAAPLSRGTDIAYRGQFVTVADTDAPIWSDALFHRLAANAMREAVPGADAAFTAVTPRRSDLGNASVSRRFVRDWLAGKGNLRVADVKGDVLLRLADAVNRQAQTAAPSQWIYVAALDPAKGVVGGRKIDPAVTYHVVLDDKAATRADVAAILEKAAVHKKLVVAGDNAWRVDDDSGAAVDTTEVVLAALTKESADPALIAPLLADESTVIVPEWRFTIEGVDVHGTGGRSSDNIAPFAVTKEARAVQPAFTQLGAHAQVAALYDTAAFAWETRFKLHYESILLVDVPGAQFQDQTDDVVLSTEGRLNSISLNGGAGGFRIVPFLQLAGDSELTPTIAFKTPGDNNTAFELPRQMLLRESLGIAAYPGGVFKEVRLGAIVQHDASEALDSGKPVRNDVGAGLESHIAVPLWKLVFTSDIDVRYFIPDADDTESDLALRAQLVHKLALPVTSSTAVFIFLDGIVLLGKKGDASRSPGWNAIAGAGFTFADLWRF